MSVNQESRCHGYSFAWDTPTDTVADASSEQEPLPADSAIIRLDASDPNLEVWRDRDISGDPPREPGPIQVGSVLTLFGLPIARTAEDLVAGEVEVAFLGAPVDMGVGFRGAGEGPTALRAMRRSVGSMETMVQWRSELTAVDFGNAPIDNLSVERSMPPIRRMVREIAETGAIPVIIGGDHSIEFANVAGLADVYGKENVGVIHFDAHYDAGDARHGHLISHAQPVRRLVDDGHTLGRNFIQVGLRGSWPGEEGFGWMRENGLRYHTMAEIDRDGWTDVMQQVLDEANDGPEYLHMSFDIDVMDPAYTSGTGTPVPGGAHAPGSVLHRPRALLGEQRGRLRPRRTQPAGRPRLHDRAQRQAGRGRVHDGDRAPEAGTRKPGLPEPAHARGRSAVVSHRAPASGGRRFSLERGISPVR